MASRFIWVGIMVLGLAISLLSRAVPLSEWYVGYIGDLIIILGLILGWISERKAKKKEGV